MIEMVYNSKETEEVSEVRVPKNIRQIGEGNQYRRIYIEDYVMATLKREPQNEEEIKYGVLLGEIKRTKDNTYVFVRGMVETREIIENSVIFNDDIWSNIYKDIKKYFEGMDIVGWFLSVPYTVKNDKSFIQKIHLDNFAGNDKLCYLNDRTEHEDGFFVFESGKLEKTEGYYIFYEKNERMKKYLKQQQENRGMVRDIVVEESDMKKVSAETIKKSNVEKDQASNTIKNNKEKSLSNSKNKAVSNNKINSDSDNKSNSPLVKKSSSVPEFIGSDVDDKGNAFESEGPVHMTFRDVIKKQMDEEQVKTSRMGNFAYGVSSVLIVALLLSTVVMLNNYGELKSIKSSIENMSGDNSVAAVNELLSSVIPTTNNIEDDVTGIDTADNSVDGEAADNIQEYPDNMYEGEDGQLYIKNVVEDSDGSEGSGVALESDDAVNEALGNSESDGHNNSANEISDSSASNYDTDTNYDNTSVQGNENAQENDLNNNSDELQLEANTDYSDDGREAAVAGGGTYHTVEPGQTLYDISISYYGDLSMVERIKEINGIDNQDMIQAGQELILPD